MQQDWWTPYIKPLPEWKYPEIGYRMAVGRIKARPPSNLFRRIEHQAYTAGLVEGEAYIGIGYSYLHRYYFPFIRVKMFERKPIERLSKLFGIATYLEKAEYKVMPVGLRAIMVARIILPHMTKDSIRQKALGYLIQKGFRLRKKNEQGFRKIYYAERYEEVLDVTELDTNNSQQEKVR